MKPQILFRCSASLLFTAWQLLPKTWHKCQLWLYLKLVNFLKITATQVLYSLPTLKRDYYESPLLIASSSLNRTMTMIIIWMYFSWITFLYLTNDLKTHLLSRSQDEALRTGVPAWLLVVAVGTGCSGRAGQGLDSLSRSSLGSGMLPMPVEALPTEWFLRWLNSDMLEEREWPVLYPEREEQRFL